MIVVTDQILVWPLVSIILGTFAAGRIEAADKAGHDILRISAAAAFREGDSMLYL